MYSVGDPTHALFNVTTGSAVVAAPLLIAKEVTLKEAASRNPMTFSRQSAG
jgi:hypothetical protein